jgi:riboflavin kinase/FMN adenylyltransferase
VLIVPQLTHEGLPVRSGAVRDALRSGDVAAAALLLGRPATVCGTVTRGDQRGRRIGFPTANLAPPPDLLIPASGVYATRAELDGREWPSVTNVGIRPTVGGTRLIVETHIFDFSEEIYGRPLRIQLIARLRDERHFPSLESLVEQIARDAAAARDLLH